jgi:predicted MFS family arabinose efflux permease
MDQHTSHRDKKGMFQAVPSSVKWLIYLTFPSSVAIGYIIIFISAYYAEIEELKPHIGLLLMVMGVSAILFAIPFGILADRIGRKPLLIIGFAATPFITLVFGLTQDLALLTVASVATGIVESAFLSSWNALIADQTDDKNRVAAFSLSFIVGTASFGIGMALPFLFPSVEDLTGFDSATVHESTVLLLAPVSALSPILLWFLLRDYKEVLHERPKLLRSKNMKPLMKFSLINSIVGLGAGFIIPLIGLWLYEEFRVEDEFSGPLLALSSVTMGLAAFASPRLSGKYGFINAIVMVQGVSTMFMLSIVFMPTAILASSFYLVRAALMNMASPMMDTVMMGLVAKEERGFASAVNSIIWRLPNSASTFFGGLLIVGGNSDLAFYIATALYATGITLFYFTFRDLKISTEASPTSVVDS